MLLTIRVSRYFKTPAFKRSFKLVLTEKVLGSNPGSGNIIYVKR